MFYHHDGFIAHTQRSRLFLCYYILYFQVGSSWIDGQQIQLKILDTCMAIFCKKRILTFLQVWCVESDGERNLRYDIHDPLRQNIFGKNL